MKPKGVADSILKAKEDERSRKRRRDGYAAASSQRDAPPLTDVDPRHHRLVTVAPNP
jgi:hypothetical protein